VELSAEDPGIGVSVRPAETRLTLRAMDFLSAGPADAVALIEHVCQMPGAPRVVAEQMAAALFTDHGRFRREPDGRWRLAPEGAAPDDVMQATPGMPPPGPRPGSVVSEAPDLFGYLPPRDELARLSYVVVDLETTGGSPWTGDRIMEVAAIVVRDGVETERLEMLVNPERPIPSIVSSLTHITWSMVRDQPTFREICGDLLRVLSGHIFVAHNATFDWRFLQSEVERATGRRLHGRRLCTVRLARRLLPHLRSRKLDSVAYHYGVTITGRHRAGGDATATAAILHRLLQDARTRDCRSWADLQRLIRAPRPPRRSRPSSLPHPVTRDTTA